MTAPVETGRPGRRGGVIDGGGVDPDIGRSLSVGQLQRALRTAGATASRPVPPRPTDRDTEHGEVKGDSQSRDASELDREPSPRPPNGLAAAASRVLGLQNPGVLLAARKMRRSGNARAGVAKDIGVWDIPRRNPTASVFAVVRRWAVLAAAMMLVVVGAVTVTGRVIAMVHPAPVLVAAAPRVSDLQFAGAAQAAVLDYLSWDTAAPRALRTTALNRWGIAGGVSDGWDGSGRLSAENAVAVAVLRLADDQAVVTVQVRTAPKPPTSAVGSTDPSWSWADGAIWLTVAVPVARRGSHIVLTMPPAIVGSPPDQAPGAAVLTTADEDADTGRATADTVDKLIAAYTSGDMEFVRGPGSTFTGLTGMVTAGQVQSWRMAKTQPHRDPSLRSGDVTVLWTLPGGAGQLRCTYRIDLVQREGRWLLQQITPGIEGRP